MRNTDKTTVEVQRIKAPRYSRGRGFLRGLGRVLDLGATLSPRLHQLAGPEEDAEALADDWKTVGDYIWFGINEVSNELEHRSNGPQKEKAA